MSPLRLVSTPPGALITLFDREVAEKSWAIRPVNGFQIRCGASPEPLPVK